jgi:hypothetical protein
LNAENLARKGILKITSYVPGKSIEEVQKEFGAKRWVKLASNENLFGPSPKAIAAIRKELPNIYLYPEGPCTILRKALAKKFAIPERKVVISNGADNLILMIANAFVNEGEEVVMADPTFSIYINATQIMGGKSVKVELKNFIHDLESMLKKVNRKTKLVFICNPNNPTGMVASKEEMKMVHETRKIFDCQSIAITCTCIRIPVFRAHCESINLEFTEPMTPEHVRDLLSTAPGVTVMDDRQHNRFPMPIDATGRDDIYVGRIRQDESIPENRGINLWVSGDQLRKRRGTECSPDCRNPDSEISVGTASPFRGGRSEKKPSLFDRWRGFPQHRIVSSPTPKFSDIPS